MAIIKQINSDFIVNEVSLEPFDLSDDHSGKSFTILELQKEGLTSFESMHLLAKQLDIATPQVVCQGLKDEDGITTQLISIKKILHADDAKIISQSGRVSNHRWFGIKVAGYSALPLRERCLHGNVFTIKIRDLSRAELNRLSDSIIRWKTFTYLNYYDSQRFGLPGKPHLTHEMGEAIIQKDYKKAFEIYIKSGNSKDTTKNVFETREIDSRQVNFFIASHYSYAWNKTLSEYIKSDTSIEIFPDYNLPISEQSPVPPMLTIDCLRMNQDWNLLKDQKSRETINTTSIYIVDFGEDDLNRGKYFLQINFMLMTGSYATMMLKQLLQKAGIKTVEIGVGDAA